MKNRGIQLIPKVLAIHDMSCFGRASLTVAIPVLSALGMEAVPLPTAILSSHLAFPSVEKVDFTPYMKAFMDAWDRSHISFDAVYSGYLATPGQIEIVKDAIGRYAKENAPVIVDPAMADKGKLYRGNDMDMVSAMKELINHATLIKPNYTEACFLTGKEYSEDHIPESSEIDEIMGILAESAPEVVITSIPQGKGKYRNISFDRKTGEKHEMVYPAIPMKTYGTGDIMSSILTAGRLKGMPLGKAMDTATVFLLENIARAWRAGADPLEGIPFEKSLVDLAGKMEM